MKIEKLKRAVVPALVLLAVVLFGVILFVEKPDLIPTLGREQVIAEGGSGGAFLPGDTDKKLMAFANQKGLTLEDWPLELRILYDDVPESEEFVLNYPFQKDTAQTADLSEYKNCTQIPHLLQWDTRWGYTAYSGNIMAVTGSGPACLSMVSIYLLQDTRYTPRYLADLSQEKGYYKEGVGSTWSLITDCGPELGLDVQEIPLVWSVVQAHLEKGNPIICAVGPGDFADNSHFIVLTGIEGDFVRVLDPRSITQSEKLWDFEIIGHQLQNLWVCQLPQ